MCGFVFSNDVGVKKKTFLNSLELISKRGPDNLSIKYLSNAILGFARLAIVDLTNNANQPFIKNNLHLICNGEIYNSKDLRSQFKYDYVSGSDCEVLIPLFQKLHKKDFLNKLDGEFAFVIYDSDDDKVFAARDAMGIRPLFYGYTRDGRISFASEVKALQQFCRDIKPFPPGHYYYDGEILSYKDLSYVSEYVNDSVEDIGKNIKNLLCEAVKKRLNSDAPVGFLLSGGIDSSLVCAIAQKYSSKPIKTFAVGMSEDAIDLKYAKEVADFIGSDHTEILINKKEVLSSISEVIRTLESFDITTVRASIGMYLICKKIKELSNVKVLLTGEVSDEIFGYKYTDFAPDAKAFQIEASKRVKELYQYDVLRADRCISSNSLEARVPFSDTKFVEYVMSINPEKKLNKYEHGKYLLRMAFDDGSFLPNSILYREKAAFSDAVGHSMVDYIKEYVDKIYTDEEFNFLKNKYVNSTPFTKESLFYREVFEEYYPQMSYLIPGFWMPNKEWDNCDVDDPSARVLPNYGLSGS